MSEIRIVITIPKEFVRHYYKDRFGESIIRLKLDAHRLAGNYERELCDMFFHAFKEAVPEWDEGGN